MTDRSSDTGSHEPAVVFDGVAKGFGDTPVVSDLDFEVERGTILGLIGPSGAGKTTVVRLMNGVYRPDAGTVSVFGADPAAMSTRDRTQFGYLPQTPVLFDELSLWENLNFHAGLNGVRLRRSSWLRELLELVELDGHEKKLVREASGGMQRRLALAATLVHEPELLMLDEPTAGIDPILRTELWDAFRSLASRGHTLIITTQYVGEAAHCEQVGLLTEGTMVAQGPPDTLRRDASGGEMVDITIEQVVDDASCAELAEAIHATTWSRTDAHRIRVVVDDATTVAADVGVVAGRRDLTIRGTEKVELSYDDMFVELVGRARRARASEQAGTSHV